MKISKIVLKNVGPYVGENSFDFSVDNKNIVLIGGKNGAGKTTFFNSIKTCIYGSKVWGFAAPGKEYYKIIEKIINVSKKYDSAVKAFVEIEMDFNDGKTNNKFRLHREWKKSLKSIEEFFFVEKNGEKLAGDEEQDFINYLLSMIPPDMFNFYFFDGESIADFFLGSDGNKNFRNAFLKLYGLDTLSIMVENFLRYSKKNGSRCSELDLYNDAKIALQTKSLELEAVNKLLAEVQTSIDMRQIELMKLKDSYLAEGGVSLSEWKEINSELSKEEAKRDELNRVLKDAANNLIPFLILKSKLKQLNTVIEEDQQIHLMKLVCDCLDTNDVRRILDKYLREKGVEKISREELIKVIQIGLGYDINKSRRFDMSDNQRNRVKYQIADKISHSKVEILKVIKELEKSLMASKKLRDRLQSSSIEGYEEYNNGISNIEKILANLRVKETELEGAIASKQEELGIAKNQFEKARHQYELLLKKKSINNIAGRAVATYSLLEERLVKEQANKLQEEFVKCFSRIINKRNFVDGVVVDKNISIIPYKLVKIRMFQIDNYLVANSKTGFLELFDASYLNEINKLRLGLVDEIILPSPITSPFSQGERQVFIMSLYLALLKTSKKDIPFFIDTPFARIDSSHRERIIEEFFLGVDNQFFILSTDEEFVGTYKKQIEHKISDTFLLTINEYGKTQVLKDVYFEV